MPIRTVSSELQKLAEVELNEDSSRTWESLNHLREWFSQQPHLKAVTVDDQWLLAFLRGCKFSLQRSKEKLDLYYTLRTIIPEFSQDRDPFSPQNQNLLQSGIFLPLPCTRDPVGPRVVLIRSNPFDPLLHQVMDVFKLCMMLVDICLIEDDNFVISGQVVILDFKSVTIKQLAQVTPILVKKFITCLQNCYPSRLKNVYFINTPQAVKNLYHAFKHFLTVKNRQRITFLDDPNDLIPIISSKVLPKEYGGESNSLNEITELWKSKVESYRNWFLQEAKYCSNEDARPGKAKTVEDVFGVEGSFLQLNID